MDAVKKTTMIINKNSNIKNKKIKKTKEKILFKEENKYYFFESDKNEKYKYTLKTIIFKNSSNEATYYYICSDSK